MDYDKSPIAAVYDAGRSYTPEVLQQWLCVLSSHAPAKVQHIIDLGCGTGRYSQALALHFGANVTAIDPSVRMLEQARRKTTSDRVVFLESSGERIPVVDSSADLVFMSMVVHHLPDIVVTARECLRVLREGGRVCIRNSTVDTPFPELGFFAGLRAVIERELPSRRRIITGFEAAGFETESHRLVRHVMAPNWGAYAEKMALRATSFIAQLPEDEFDLGIAKLRAHANGADPTEEVSLDIDFFVFNKSANTALAV
jgi:ubiquinone/menaquinone biosynthesis C-methylase UbiE